MFRTLASLGLILLAAGCGTVPQPEAVVPVRAVHLVILNLGDCAWKITLTPSDGKPVRVLQPAARESLEFDLAGGSYGIEQIALDGRTGAGSVRRFTIHLEPGQTYRWRLATLLSSETDGTRRDTANNEHEREH